MIAALGRHIVLAIALASPVMAAAKDVQSGLSASDLFALAAQAAAANKLDNALAIYRALARDPDAEIRAEARFRQGMLLSTLGRYADAATVFRALLDEKPNATRVRLELARVLARMGDEAGARRSLRQAEAAGLPADVRAVVNQFAMALRSRRTFGGSLQLALAPDSNVNRATEARTLDTVIAPLTLSRDARAQSGLGFRASGQGYARIALSPNLSLLPRISGIANLYRASEFDDLSASTLLGLEWQTGRDRLTPSVGPTWRWYGGRLYARTDTAAIDWVHPIGQRIQLTVSGSAAHAGYHTNTLQTGGLFDLSVGGEYALDKRTGVSATIGATRQTARDPGYATVAAYTALSGWHDLGRTTVFASGVVRRTVGDERLFLFPDRRREWLVQLSAGATFRQLTVKGFAPLVRVTAERNVSTVGLYRYRRFATDLGIVRAF